MLQVLILLLYFHSRDHNNLLRYNMLSVAAKHMTAIRIHLGIQLPLS